MRIAVVHSFYREGPSGENNLVEAEVRVLREAGHDVQVFSLRTDELAKSKNYAISAGIRVSTGWGPTPKRQLDDFQPDVVQVHNLFPNWSDRWLDEIPQPVVSTLHNFRPLCAAGTLSLNGQFCSLCPTIGSKHAVINACYQESHLKSVPLAIATRRPDRNRVLKHSDMLVMRSREALKLYQSFIEQDLSSKTAIIPNFIENPQFSGAGTPREAESSWVYVGRLSPEKGVRQMVQNWPDRIPLRIFGSGPLEKELIAAGTRKAITFMGAKPRDEVLMELRKATGLVFPSVWTELAPLSFLEALSVGLPVIAKSGNAAAAEIFSSNCGHVFDDFSEMEDAIEKTSDDWSALSRNAQDIHRAKYSPEAWLEAITRVYYSVLAR